MARLLIILAVVAAAFWVYSIVDCAVQPPTRHRGVSKPVWILITLLLPVLGGILWFTIGRDRGGPRRGPRAPDDDPEFLGRLGTMSDQDERIRRLEEELAQLDAEEDDPRWRPAEPPSPGAGEVGGVPEASAEGDAPPARRDDGDEQHGRRDDGDEPRGRRGAVG